MTDRERVVRLRKALNETLGIFQAMHHGARHADDRRVIVTEEVVGEWHRKLFSVLAQTRDDLPDPDEGERR